VIYEVHFMEDGRVVGCREEELIDANAEWVPSLYEFREQVRSRKRLGVNGTIIAEAGDVGQVLKVLRQQDGVAYHVRFPGHTLLVPEAALEGAGEQAGAMEAVE
jgi:nitrogen fixation protein NifZ